ncbi:hypothetical protein EUGRSUZ_H02747 [Eucalyptus grandis]|uniref:Uncharacterized protein n=2 Tax=Eucalyptus grandis TaxID=71139 RepID=A0ACC3JSS1_EUCGR|nr:hypothetical protein EUGRSUZ_H02747 [Eucalyptus grandis]
MAESIPEDVLIDILLRVPAESLVRFKLVCKRLKAGDLIPRQRILIGGYQTIDFKTLDANEGRVAVPHNIKTIKPDSNWRIVGSCDGLVCFLVSGIFLIYNPTTREYRELPSSDFEEDCELLDRNNESFYGLGYDPRSDDYKIVEGIHEYFDRFWGAAIFSLKSGSWRRIYFPIEEIEEIVYWKGALHWHVYGLWDETGILSLDLSEEKFHQVLLAPKVETDGRSRPCMNLGIHGTSLFIYSSYGNHVHTWITDEYGRGGSWTKWFSVDWTNWFSVNWTNRFSVDPNVSIPLVCTRSGKIIFLINRDQLILFNPEDNTYKDYPYKDYPYNDFSVEYAIYLETLISPYLF